MSIVKVAGLRSFAKKVFSNGVAMAENAALKKELGQAAVALKNAEELAAKNGSKMMPLVGGTAIGAGGVYAYQKNGQSPQGYY